MIYSLLVLSSPYTGRGSYRAAEFARSVLARGHSINRVFFLDEGASSGAASAVFPQDELSPVDTWAELGTEHSLDLVLCISSALRRGMLDEHEARRRDKPAATVHTAFTVSGLGQLVDATDDCDRLVTFGG